MTDVFSITMPFRQMPEYDYAQRLRNLDPQASEAQRGSIFDEEPLEGNPKDFRFTRSLSHILSEFGGE